MAKEVRCSRALEADYARIHSSPSLLGLTVLALSDPSTTEAHVDSLNISVCTLFFLLPSPSKFCTVDDTISFSRRIRYEIQSIRQQIKITTRTSSSESGDRYASLAYEHLVRSVWEESGSRSAAARAAHETAKVMMIVRLEKSIMGWGNDPRCLWERRTSLSLWLYTGRVARTSYRTRMDEMICHDHMVPLDSGSPL